MEVGITWGVAASASAATSGSAWSWCVAAGAGGVAAGTAGGVGGVTAGAAGGVGITAVVAGALASPWVVPFAAVVPVAAVAGAGAWLYSSISCAGEASERESSGLVLLGRGNFGSVLRDGDLAVKRNSNGTVRREAELLERCQSEFVVQLIRSNGEALWMELCCGGTLAAQVKLRAGPNHMKFQKKVAEQLLTAVGHLHAVGVIHRDVKADNVLLTASLTVRLADFGSAGYSTSMQFHRDVVGSLTNLAPEALPALPDMQTCPSGYKGRPVDVWACGVTIFEAAVGFPPFRGRNLRSLFSSIKQGVGCPGFYDMMTCSAHLPALPDMLACEPQQRCSALEALRLMMSRELLLDPGMSLRKRRRL